MKSKINKYQEDNHKIVSKTKLFLSSLLSLLFASSLVAQDRTTVNATSSEISDNLDLRAVASIFGDSKNLEDFENRLNDPKTQISNLDLNGDNQVDYLRVIESVEGRTHLIVVQSVLGKDTFQDVATIEVERDSNNRVQVQVVGDVYMYGTNYIYEPVYVSTPIIYNYFWTPSYRPYCSNWYWDYYPSYYTYWNPCPVFRYRHNIGLWINFDVQYNYVNYRRCEVAYNNYYGRRSNGYERQYPNRSFSDRNSGYSNRRELENTRTTRDVAYTTRENSGTRNNASADTPIRQTNGNIRGNSNTRTETSSETPIRQTNGNIRVNSGTRTETSSDTPIRQTNGNIRVNSGTRTETSSETPIRQTNATIRGNSEMNQSQTSPERSSNFPSRDNSNVRQNSSPRMESSAPQRSSEPRSSGNSDGGSRGNSESRGSRR
jgi:hypothetical protein